MPRKTPRPAPDPAQAANARILADRQDRIDEKMKAIPDLGLDLKESPPASADEFLDEWDKKAFGRHAETTTRWVYGPDPLIDNCPALAQAIQKEGLEAFAEATRIAILMREHEAVADPIMRRGLYGAIQKFGKEAVAESFARRILKIPAREVEYEIGDETFGDPLLLGSNALRDCVMRYGNEPGMSYKFLSARCIDVLGLRGYVLVPDDKGEPAKAGTLFLAKIPTVVAEGRRRKYAAESEQRVKDAEEEYMVESERLVRSAGAHGAGSRPLQSGEIFRGNASETEALLDTNLEMGVRVERQA